MDKNKMLLFLDFNGKLANDVFDKEAFIRIANLHKKSPFVQINDTLFKGSYDFALGTNLFFEAAENAPKENDLFIKRGPIQFENVFDSTKIIDLKSVKVPPRKIEISNEDNKIEFNLDWDYKTILEKFSDGSLQIHDIIKNPVEDQVKGDIEHLEENESKMAFYSMEKDANLEIEIESVNDTFGCESILKEYQKLKQVASRPIKMSIKEEEVEECDPKFKTSYKYHNLERQILKPCDFFFNEPVGEINEQTLSNCVDIDRCILYGIIEESTLNPRILTDDEKRKLLSLDNFDNLSLAGRYYVLKNQVKDLEEYLNNKTETELNVRDQYGRLPKETLEIYKNLMNAVRKRIEEIKYYLKDN